MESGTFGRIHFTLIHVHDGMNYMCMRKLVLVFVRVYISIRSKVLPLYKDEEIIHFDIHEFLVRWSSYM
jgi:hypothetical protein